jgi:hypothetical protein
MATKIPLSALQYLKKLTQIGIFGLKIYHLATLIGTQYYLFEARWGIRNLKKSIPRQRPEGKFLKGFLSPLKKFAPG